MNESLKISIVTAVRDSARTIASTLESVASQSHPNIEHLVLDGMSSDNTFDIVQQNLTDRVRAFQEPDDGIYHALNKGIEKATGSVVGFLHADDLLASPDVISAVAEVFSSGNVDAVYGDLLYVDLLDTNKIVRYWKAGEFNRHRFRRGWMPPHPTFYLRQECYQRLGGYRTDFGSGADYELMLRMLYKQSIRVAYLPKIMVRMRVGGTSNASLNNRLKANKSDRQAWVDNGFKPPFGLRFTKPLSKLRQYFTRPDQDLFE